MVTILEKLFCEQIKEASITDYIKEIDVRLERNKKILKTHLNKREKKLLLRIIDDKDLIIEETNLNSFIHGFKVGLKVGYEVNQDY